MPPAPITFDFARSVFYPASGTDGAPIKYFSTWFQSFFYADLGMTCERFEKIAAWESMLLHYRRSSVAWLAPETVFGCRMEQTIFCCHLRFERDPRAPKDKDLPAKLELLFTNCEGVQALAAYRIRKTYPAAATYIRVGLGFGGNYETFRKDYAAALNAIGPVPCLIIDDEGLDKATGYYFDYCRNFPTIVYKTPIFAAEGNYGKRRLILRSRN